MKQALIIDAQGMVDYDLYQIQKLDDQFLEIMNLQIDDFDVALSQIKKKKEILSGVATKAAEREAAHQLEVYLNTINNDFHLILLI